MYQRIVVPLDGSKNSEIALREADCLSEVTGAQIHLVRVVPFTREDQIAAYSALNDPTEIIAAERDMASRYLQSLIRAHTTLGKTITYEVRVGDVVAELDGIARPGDVYVMASHGRSGLARWFMGSVAENVMRRIPVPVLLVKVFPSAAASTLGPQG